MQLEIEQALFLQNTALEALTIFKGLVDLDTELKRVEKIILLISPALTELAKEIEKNRVSELEIFSLRQKLSTEKRTREVLVLQKELLLLQIPNRLSPSPITNGNLGRLINPQPLIRDFENRNLVQYFETKKVDQGSRVTIDGFIGQTKGIRIYWSPTVQFFSNKSLSEDFELEKARLEANQERQRLEEIVDRSARSRSMNVIEIQIEGAIQETLDIQYHLELLKSLGNGGVRTRLEILDLEQELIEAEYRKELLQDRLLFDKIHLQLLYGEELWEKDILSNQIRSRPVL